MRTPTSLLLDHRYLAGPSISVVALVNPWHGLAIVKNAGGAPHGKQELLFRIPDPWSCPQAQCVAASDGAGVPRIVRGRDGMVVVGSNRVMRRGTSRLTVPGVRP